MRHFSAYIICGTPRSGSTLLCGMLAETGVAGRPNSYFRRQDIPTWAQAWGVAPLQGPDDPQFDSSYLAAMRREGTADTGIFGLRLMWENVVDAAHRLNRRRRGTADFSVAFEEAFGRTLYIHLSRRDKVAQAVSLLRAEQSGLWHLGRDGTVLEGPVTPQPIAYDAGRIGQLVHELEEDDGSWARFFTSRRIEPLRLTYETMAAEPQRALADILSALGRHAAIAEVTKVKTARMADATSLEWIERYRRERGRGV